MLFNSFEFVFFLIGVYFLYWYVFNKNLNIQNIFLLLCSYFFYACWDWRFVFLLFLSTFIDYGFGLLIYNSKKRKRLFLWLSIVNNLAILGFFKYYNFFALNAKSVLFFAGVHFDPWLLNIVLPVGISFYTFHGMSYVFDIYNNRTTPTRNFVEYAVFVCFFPLLVSGPIERATHLLPQVQLKRKFSYQQSLEGFRLILWGYFLKVVIADSLSVFVSNIFKNYTSYTGSTLVLGVIYFAIQVYGDFCGYTNIAIGVAKLFGFELLSNFNYPYFSTNLGDFWRRWHISLSSWLNDYLYVPLSVSWRNYGKAAIAGSIIVTFLVSGFWHGAAWKFIAWGGLHGIGLSYEALTRKTRKKLFKKLPQVIGSLTGWLFTFCYVCFTYIFFRAADLSTAVDYVHHIGSGILKPVSSGRLGIIYVVIPLLIDWQQRRSERNVLSFSNKFIRRGLYIVLGITVLIYSANDEAAFIYFQF